MMQHSWSLDYLYRRMSPAQVHTWAVAKAAELEAKTGVKWSRSHVAGRYAFLPYVDRDTRPLDDPDKLWRFIEAYREVKSDFFRIAHFVAIAKRAGLSIADTVGLAKHLVTSGQAHLHVDRAGKGTYIKVR